jgi:acyl phosphate:glycerol-3-phosphate acyltransferase
VLIALAIIIGYFCGSIPFGLLLTRAAGLGDVRNIGSGNIGATNVLRTGNKKLAALTLLCDLLKGAIPVIIAKYVGGDWAVEFAGFAAMAGHIFPVWLGFKGGKGVATAFGVLLAWSWPVALVGFAVWIVVFLVSRISSQSALAASVAAAVAAHYVGGAALWPPVAILAVIVWITHRKNIERLIKGEEPKMSFTKKL